MSYIMAVIRSASVHRVLDLALVGMGGQIIVGGEAVSRWHSA